MRKKIRGFLCALVLVFFSVTVAFGATVEDRLSNDAFREGMLRLQYRQYAAAVQAFERALTYSSLNYKVYYYLGFAQLAQGYVHTALNTWANQMEVGAGDPLLHQKIELLTTQSASSLVWSQPVEAQEYLFSSYFDGLTEGQHMVLRPGFLHFDPEDNLLYLASMQGKSVIALTTDKRVQMRYGHSFIGTSDLEMPTGVWVYNDRIYVADYQQDQIWVYEPAVSTGNVVPLPVDTEQGFRGPMGILFSAEGDLYVVDNGNNRIQQYSPDLKWVRSIGEGLLSRPTALALTNEHLYVSDTGHQRVLVFDTSGNLVQSIGDSTLREPRGLAIRQGILYIMDAQSGLYTYNLSANLLSRFSVDEGKYAQPFGVALDAEGFIYGSDVNGANVAIFVPVEMRYNNLDVRITQIWTDEYPRNVLHVMIFDREGVPIRGLRAPNFRIYEDGEFLVERNLVPTYAYRDRLFTQVLVERTQFVENYEQEVSGFLQSFFSNGSPDDLQQILLIDGSNHVASDTLSAPSPKKNFAWAQTMPYAGDIPIGLGRQIYEAITRSLAYVRNRAVVLVVSGKVGEASFSEYNMSVLIHYARFNAVPIYVVALSDDGRSVYENLARQTFGEYYLFSDIEDILELNQSIRSSPPLEYMISYNALNLLGVNHDYFVNLQLEVDYKGLKGLDRTGYFVPREPPRQRRKRYVDPVRLF